MLTRETIRNLIDKNRNGDFEEKKAATVELLTIYRNASRPNNMEEEMALRELNEFVENNILTT